MFFSRIWRGYIVVALSLGAAHAEVPPESIKQGNLEGIVLDSQSGEPLIGANVMLSGTNLGASTDAKGKFRIQRIPTGEYELLTSYIGYAASHHPVAVRERLNSEMEIALIPSIMEASTVVVTGTASPHLYTSAPVKTEVIPRQLIQQSQACNLAEALSLQNGVRVENNCQNCNFTQVRILGMEGRYSQLLIDSAPVVSSLAGVYALEHFPDEMIDQIEIVKGGGSALYGGGAIAGTINMRTRRPYLNRSRISVQNQSLDGSTDRQVSAVTELVTSSANTGVFLYGVAREREDYDHNGDGYSELGTLHHESFGLNWFRWIDHQREATLSFNRVYEHRRGGNDFDRPYHEADIAEALTHERTGARFTWNRIVNSDLSYTYTYDISVLERSSYYGGLGGDTAQDSLDALAFYGQADNQTQVLNARLSYNRGSHQFTAGSEYYQDQLKDNSVSDERYHLDESHSNGAVFIQDSYTFWRDLATLVTGARYDKHSTLANGIISPRMSLMVNGGEHLHFRGSLSTGFKAPQTFDEDLHIESLGGDQRVVRNAPDLGPERSLSWTVNMEFENLMPTHAFMAGITLYQTKLKDAFSESQLASDGSDLILWQRINSSGAIVNGLELDLGYMPHPDLEFRLGGTYKQGRYDEAQEIFDNISTDKFLRTPDFFGNMRMSWDLSPRFNINSLVRYTGTMIVPDEANLELVTTEDDFYELDLGMRYDPNLMEDLKLSLVFGAKNVLNAYQKDLQVGVDRDPAYLYGPQLPRRYVAEINLSF